MFENFINHPKGSECYVNATENSSYIDQCMYSLYDTASCVHEGSMDKHFPSPATDDEKEIINVFLKSSWIEG